MNLVDLLDRPIAFQRSFVSLGVGITGALMLSQAIYWTGRTSDVDGWFWKTAAEWEAETGLTRREQDGARERLRAIGVLEEVRREIPAKLFYRVNIEALEAALGMHQTAKQGCTKAPNSMHQTANLYAPNSQSNTKTTSKTTQRSIYSAGAKPEAKPKPSAPAIPDWIPADEWKAFVEYRSKIKAPLTDHAVKVAIDKLDKFRAAGENIADVLNQTILSGKWTGLFPVRNDARAGYQKGSGQGRPQSRHERNLETANEIRRRADGASPVQHGGSDAYGYTIDGYTIDGAAVEVDRQAVFENV